MRCKFRRLVPWRSCSRCLCASLLCRLLLDPPKTPSEDDMLFSSCSDRSAMFYASLSVQWPEQAHTLRPLTDSLNRLDS